MGGANHWDYTHEYINGVLTVIEEISDTSVRFENMERLVDVIPILSDYEEWSMQLFIRYKLNRDTREMDVIERKYKFYIHPDGTLIAEYEVDSEIGRQITPGIS